MTHKFTKSTTAALVLAWLVVVLPDVAMARDDKPKLRFGLTLGLMLDDNRGLDAVSLGSTAEYNAKLDFGITFATPIQSLDVSGNFGFRTVSGAEAPNLRSGLNNPSLTLSYKRNSRDAEFSFKVFGQHTDASSTSLILDDETLDLSELTEFGNRFKYGFDTTLELRKRSPLGVKLSFGYNELRYSNTTSASLTDQDRHYLGARFRFDLNPTTQATLDTRYSTFEDFGSALGQRKTFSLDAKISQKLGYGSAFGQAGMTSTEDGERYTLSIGSELNTALWSLQSSLGLSKGITNQIDPIGSLSLTRKFARGELAGNLERSVRSGSNDTEQTSTKLGIRYSNHLTQKSLLNVSFAYSENNPTGVGNSSSLGSFGINLRHTLDREWQMNIGLEHRVIETSAGVTARDNRFTLSLRHDLTARY